MEEEPTLRPGYRLDRYELLCPVASGGMAAVWLAQLRGKRGFEKLFAIKTIKTELTDDVRFQEMFLDEARIASGIEHPNVSHIVDLGEQGSILYIVMEWVDGESLTKVSRLARKRGTPLPLGVTLRLIADACAGLHAAHELRDAKGETLGVVHRDVSPQNILVTSAGSVKVIDFGVAKARNRRAGETAAGVVKGKIRYMAPEQVQNENVDRRADIWAIGVCLHELATGTLPFEEESDIDMVRKLIGKEPLTISADVPDAIREILIHSITRDPNDRFDTAAAMRRAIENAIVKLGLDAQTDDVAGFLATNLPELEEKRRASINQALAEVGERVSSRSVVDAAEIPFAETVVSKPAGRDVSASGLTTGSGPGTKSAKRPVQSARDVLSGKDDSTRTSFVDDEEVRGLPSNRGFYAFFTLVAVVAGAWFVWPGKVALREFAGRHGIVDAPKSEVPDPLLASSAATLPLPSASAASSVAVDASSPSLPIPSAAPSTSAVAVTRPNPTPPVTTTPSTATGVTTVVVPPPAPSTSEEDPSGPY